MDAVTLISGILATFLLSWAGVSKLRQMSLARNWLDIPNERSSHVIPTPRGGGLAVIGTIVVVTLIFTLFGFFNWRSLLAIAPACIVAAVGLIDDRRGLSAKQRLSSHLICGLASTLAIFLLVGPPQLHLGDLAISSGFLVGLFWILFISWMTNLYNFMDGIDGIEGIQVATVSIVAGCLALSAGDSDLAQLYFIAASGFLGFLMLNWPPAKIFLGDVGSGSIGFLMAVLAMIGSARGTLSLAAILILHGSFIVDTGFTLVVRIRRGERPHEAHRTHTYQKAVRKGWAHARVSGTYGLVNVFWLAPWAVFSQMAPSFELLALACAWAPLVATCWFLKAGQEGP